MNHKSGLEATEEILKEFPDAKILLLTTFSDDEYIVKALKLGVKGYLLKTVNILVRQSRLSSID